MTKTSSNPNVSVSSGGYVGRISMPGSTLLLTSASFPILKIDRMRPIALSVQHYLGVVMMMLPSFYPPAPHASLHRPWCFLFFFSHRLKQLAMPFGLSSIHRTDSREIFFFPPSSVLSLSSTDPPSGPAADPGFHYFHLESCCPAARFIISYLRPKLATPHNDEATLFPLRRRRSGPGLRGSVFQGAIQ